MEPGGGPGPYEEVRRKLVERGYLEGRIERFVLRDGGGASGRPTLAGAGFRAALLGGPILGGLLAAAAARANRPVLRATDDLVLWAYFSVLAGVALYLLQLAASLVVAGLARRRGARRDDTLRASLLVGLPILCYLLLIVWGNGSGSGLVSDALFLAAALVATLLVAWLAGVVSLAGIIGRTGQVPDRSRRRARALVLVLLPIAAATLVARSAMERDDGGPIPPQPFEVARDASAILFVGVDGLDSSLVASLGHEGAFTSLARRRAKGADFVFRRAAGMEPAEVWTTLMTGMPAEAHGVRSAGAERLPGIGAPLRSEGGPALLGAALRFLLPGRTVPTSGAARRVRTLWEIVDLKAPAAAVGFWASWPAREPGSEPRGYVVSDRALAKLLSGAVEDRDTAPESLFQALAVRFPDDRAALREEFDLAFGSIGEPPRSIAWESFLIDAYHARTVRRLRQDDRIRASFVYLPGLDILRSRLAGTFAGKAASDALVASRTLEAYVSWLDRLLEDLVSSVEDGTAIVVADPGRSATGNEEGFVLVTGAGCAGGAIGQLDVTPLVLSLAGFPHSAEMPGRAPTACRAAAPDPREVASYGRKGASRAIGAIEDDRELLERLRSLGYVR